MAGSRQRIGTRLRALRAERGWSQGVLAERASLSAKFLGEIERGQANPTVQTLDDLAQALGVQLVDLVNDAQAQPWPAISTGEFVHAVRELRDSLDQAIERVTSGDFAAATLPADSTKPAVARRPKR